MSTNRKKKTTKGKGKQIDPASPDAPESVRAPWRERKKKQYLEVLTQNGGMVVSACEVIDIHPQLLYKWRAVDDEFDKAIEVAVEQSTDVLEEEAIRRAIIGYEGRPVVHQGEIVQRMTEYSDTLLIMLLKSRRAKFNSRNELVGPDGNAIELRVVYGEDKK